MDGRLGEQELRQVRRGRERIWLRVLLVLAPKKARCDISVSAWIVQAEDSLLCNKHGWHIVALKELLGKLGFVLQRVESRLCQEYRILDKSILNWQEVSKRISLRSQLRRRLSAYCGTAEGKFVTFSSGLRLCWPSVHFFYAKNGKDRNCSMSHERAPGRPRSSYLFLSHFQLIVQKFPNQVHVVPIYNLPAIDWVFQLEKASWLGVEIPNVIVQFVLHWQDLLVLRPTHASNWWLWRVQQQTWLESSFSDTPKPKKQQKKRKRPKSN